VELHHLTEYLSAKLRVYFLTRPKIYGDGGTADLFGKPELPDGFHYLPDVLSPAEENAFVRQFEKLPLKPFEFHGYLGNRRIYSFGHRYIFAGQEPRADPSIPDYLRPLTEIANQISGMPAEAFEQLMVTEYAPGAGIGWHRDRPTCDCRRIVSRALHVAAAPQSRGRLGAALRSHRPTLGVFARGPGA